LREVSVGGCATTEYSAEMVGLTIAEGKESWLDYSAILSRPGRRSIAGADAIARAVERNVRSRISVADG
jgi:hypothetical protein